MRLAIVGKGGVGKTAIAATLARLLARQGRRVLAVDFDECPGLDLALGLEASAGGLPREALEEAENVPYGWQLASGLTPVEAIALHARPAADGVRLLNPGKLLAREQGRYARSITAVRQIVERLADPDWDVIGDLAAGVTQPYEGYHTFAEQVLIVISPSWSSQLVASRLRPLVQARSSLLVGSRWRASPTAATPALDWQIPEDPEVRAADRADRPLLDHAPESAAVRAVQGLAELLCGAEVAA